jgi:2,4-dienoyl-CoA reductase-like NADH-dependent reductase (Old Yellow Enzyme family)/thioredoxin reductase
LGKIAPIQLRIDQDRFISGLNRLVEEVHAEGAKIALQLNHCGRRTNLAITGGRKPVSASAVQSQQAGVKARPLRIGEIEHLTVAFADAARRAAEAGFDAVEIHGAHGYLIGQFLSPYTNRRRDQYGGSFQGRMRFALEILERCRDKVGVSFPILFRLSGNEFFKGGLTPEDARAIAARLEKNGVDAIHVSVGLMESRQWACPPMCVPPGCFENLAEGIKKLVKIPVIAVGRINDPQVAERILQEQKADLIAMGRALIADPHFPEKVSEGRFGDIVPCIACNRGCIMRIDLKLSIRCATNPLVGREKEHVLTPTTKKRRVLVVGGGPAGMEAASVAASRGHEVILCEKNSKLGGQVILGTAPPYKDEIGRLTKYLSWQLEKQGVQVKLNSEVTKEMVEEIEPEVLVLATGALPLIPDIPGVRQENVRTAWDVLAGNAEVGEEIVVVGGGTVGCETAELLVRKGKKVTILEMLSDIALDMETRSRTFMLERFREHGIKALTNSKVEEITEGGVIIKDKKGRKREIAADSAILALGSVPNRKAAESLATSVPSYMIGDCVRPRKILDSIYEGYLVGSKI